MDCNNIKKTLLALIFFILHLISHAQNASYLIYVEYNYSYSAQGGLRKFTDLRISPKDNITENLFDLDVNQVGGCDFTQASFKKAGIITDSRDLNFYFYDDIEGGQRGITEITGEEPVINNSIINDAITNGHRYSHIEWNCRYLLGCANWRSGSIDVKATIYHVPTFTISPYHCIWTKEADTIPISFNLVGLKPSWANYYLEVSNQPFTFGVDNPQMNVLDINSLISENGSNTQKYSYNDLVGVFGSAWWGQPLYFRIKTNFDGISSCYNTELNCTAPFYRPCDPSVFFGPNPGNGYFIDNSQYTNIIQRFPNPAITYQQPSCKGGNDSKIFLNFPEVDNINNYILSITKLVKKVNSNCVSSYAESLSSSEDYLEYCHGNTGDVIGENNTTITITKDNIDNNFLLIAGKYEIKAVAAMPISCIFTDTFTIPEPDSLQLLSAASPVNYIWNDTFQIQGYGAKGSININLKGGTPPYKYSINNGASYIDNINTQTYTYPGIGASYDTIKVTDAHNCPTKFNKVIPVRMRAPDPVNIESVSYDTVSCHKDDYGGTTNNGGLHFHITGGIGPYNVSLNSAANIVSPADDNYVDLLETLTADPYNIIVHDLYISGNSLMVNIPSQNPLLINPIPESDKTWPDCIGGKNGSATVSGQGGEPFESGGAYKFVIEGMSDTIQGDKSVLINLEAVTYNVRIKDKLGCVGRLENITIPQNPNPLHVVLTDTVHPTCFTYNDGTADFTHKNGVSLNADTSIHQFNYSLTNLDGTPEYSQSHSEVDTGKFDQIKKGWYRIEISDKYQCPINYAYSDTIFISEPDQIKIETKVKPSRKGQHNGSIWFKFTGGSKNYIYQWYKKMNAEADSLVAQGTTRDSASITGLGIGDYQLQVSDTCFCTNGHGESDNSPWLVSGPFTVSEPDKALSFTVLEHKNVSCNGLSDGSLVIESTGGWGNNFLYGLHLNQLTYDGTFSNLPAGLDTIYVKDELDEIFWDTVRITEPMVLSASIQHVNNISCNGLSDGSFILNITGGTQPYHLSLDNNLTKTQGTELSGLSVNSYQVLVTDTNGCNTQVNVTITQPDPLSIKLDEVVNTLCRKSTGQISVTCSGGTSAYSYQWLDNSNNPVGTMAVASSLTAGVYQLSITDAHQCSKLSPKYTITNTDGPLITDTIITPVSCYGYLDGKAKVIVGNGLKPYSYLWSNGQTTDLATNLSSDSCMVMVTDNNKCPNSAVIYIPHPNSLTIATTSIGNPQCYNSVNGNIAITGNGGTPNYQYLWSNGNTGSNITGLRSGDYIATVTDSHNCITSKIFSLSNPEPVILELGGESTVCTGQTVALDAGDFAAYNWTSDNGFTGSTRIVKISDQGKYYLQVLDAHGCLGKDTFYLHTSTSLLNAKYLIKSDAAVGDTVVAIDISWPLPDSVYWTYDRSLIKTSKSEKDYEWMVFNTSGTYYITLNAILGNCRDSYTDKITIQQQYNEQNLELGAKDPLILSFIVSPNPNNGCFTAEVTLREQNDISLKLYNFSTLTNQKNMKGQDNYVVDYSIPNMTPGVYILELVAGNEHKMLKMIVY
jgi:hypothetical protein